jgi:hypothetical protein
MDDMDLTADTAELTVETLADFAARTVPNRAELRGHAADMQKDAPLLAMIPRSIIGQDKVIHESGSAEENLAMDVERHAMLLCRTNGAVIGLTASRASVSVGLTPEHLLVALEPLALDGGARRMLAIGIERLIAGDFVSSVHVLVPRVEDALRHHLRAAGVDTTRFNPDVGDGTSRTDDATLGALLRAAMPDGRTVREYLGNDFWEQIDGALNSRTGLNLRNDVAHGLARPGGCTVETAGLCLGLLLQLANLASGRADVSH